MFEDDTRKKPDQKWSKWSMAHNKRTPKATDYASAFVLIMSTFVAMSTFAA